MDYIRPKKYLGQHFLKDENIARKIISSLTLKTNVVELGPGTGVLTKFLIHETGTLKLIEIDSESVEHLKNLFPEISGNIIHGDFLKTDLPAIFDREFSLIGNFPYNISSQIFFKVIENRQSIPEIVGMIQKEVAERIVSPPCNKTYGILSVLLGAFYETEILFTVSEKVFQPPPKVQSAVVRLVRKNQTHPDCDENLFFRLVKSAFNQRRKTLRNSLKQYIIEKPEVGNNDIFTRRPEQLSTSEFIELTKLVSG